jgi:endoribonuclease Dicer
MRQLFLAFPKADSGALSWLKMVFVCNASLAYLSVRLLELHQHLLHDSAALSRTIHLHVEEIRRIDLNKMVEEIWDYHPPKLFADIFEAVCGAIFIDCGYNVDIVTEVLGPVLSPFFASLKHASQIDPISTLIRWAVRVYKCQQIRFIRVDPVIGQPEARLWYSVVLHGTTIATAGADHAHTAKCRGSQIAFEALRKGGLMKELCDCRPADMDIDDPQEHRDDWEPEEENLMEEELLKVFALQ